MDKKFFMFLVVIPVLPILLLIDNLWTHSSLSSTLFTEKR